MTSSPDSDAVLSTLPAGLLEAATGTHETITRRTMDTARARAEADGTRDTAVSAARLSQSGALPRVTFAGSAGVAAQLDLQDVLGSGGMGVVRLARQRALEREVAVKTLHEDQSATAGASDLIEEARVMGQLEHPAVVPVHMLGEDEQGRPLVVMKRIAGVTWTELARDTDHELWNKFEHGSADADSHHLRIFMQVCHAIEFAHEHGILHRDLKPENVMVGGFGEVHVLDWGIALRLAEADDPAQQGVVGTPACMAPEMLTGKTEDVDERTDVFLLGATLYEVLTGRARHRGRRVPAVLVAAMECDPPDFSGFDTPDELVDIVRRATAKEKEDRVQSVRELRGLISGYLEHRSSLRLTDRADAAAEDLDRALERARDDEDARSDVLTCFTRCRHGYWLALDTWSENARARAGLEGVLSTMVGFYIETRQDEAAAALLKELGDAGREDQHAALATLRKRLAEERTAQLALSSMFRELDPSVARRERVTLLLALGVAAIVVTGVLAALRVRGVDMMGSVALFALAAGFAVAYAVGVAVARKQVLATKLNRRIVLGVGVLLSGLVVNRSVALLTGIPPDLILVYDTLAFTMVGLAGAVTLDRRIAWILAVAVPGLFLSAWRPELSQAVFPAVVLVTVGGVVVWHRSRRKATT